MRATIHFHYSSYKGPFCHIERLCYFTEFSLAIFSLSKSGKFFISGHLCGSSHRYVISTSQDIKYFMLLALQFLTKEYQVWRKRSSSYCSSWIHHLPYYVYQIWQIILLWNLIIIFLASMQWVSCAFLFFCSFQASPVDLSIFCWIKKRMVLPFSCNWCDDLLHDRRRDLPFRNKGNKMSLTMRIRFDKFLLKKTRTHKIGRRTPP